MSVEESSKKFTLRANINTCIPLPLTPWWPRPLAHNHTPSDGDSAPRPQTFRPAALLYNSRVYMADLCRIDFYAA